MFKLVVPVVVVLILAIGGFFLYQNFQTRTTQQPASTSQAVKTPIPASSPITTTDPCEVLTKGSIDFPPLYNEGITWQQPTVTEDEVPLGEEGSREIRGCLIKSKETTDEVSLRVTGYYDENLQKLEWKILVTASGVYSSTDSYQKTNKYFVVKRHVSPGAAQQTPNPSITIEIFYTQ